MLCLTEKLLNKLDSQKLLYCHFKSNNTLSEALNGIGDIDLLIHPKYSNLFFSTIHSLGFKEAKVDDSVKSPYISHYYGLDNKTGKLLHLHVYTRLVTGGSLVKNHWLGPIENILLHSVTQHQTLPVPVPSPEAELINLVVRKHIEQNSLFENYLYHKDFHGVKKELLYLSQNCDWHKINYWLKNYLPYISLNHIQKGCIYLKEKKYFLQRFILGLQLNISLWIFQINPFWKTSWHRLSMYWKAFWKVRLNLNGQDKTFSKTGAVVAFVGAEASGKSTCSNSFHQWISNDFQSLHLHLGKPRKTWLTRPFWIMALSFVKLKQVIMSLKKNEDFSKIKIIDYSKPPHTLICCLDAIDKFFSVKRAFKICLKGGIVVTDRYPSHKIDDIDGPRIRETQKLCRIFAKIEQYFYRRIPRPTMLFIVHAPLDETLRRNQTRSKGPEPEDFVIYRHQKISKQHFSDSVKFNIDTSTANEQETLIQIKQLFWKHL